MSETHKHESKDLVEELKDAIVITKDPAFASYSTIRKLGLIAIELLEAGGELAHTVKDEAQLTAALYKVWDEVVVPIDLPLNDAMEMSLEFAGRQLIAPVVHGIYTNLKTA